jgi:hypothetical protein
MSGIGVADNAGMPKGDLRTNRSRLLKPLNHHLMIIKTSIIEPVPTRASSASRARVSTSGVVGPSRAATPTLLSMVSTSGAARPPGFLSVASSASRSLSPSPSASPAHLRSSPRSCSPPPRCLSIRHTSVHRPRSRAYDIAPPFAGLWLTKPPPVVNAPGRHMDRTGL